MTNKYITLARKINANAYGDRGNSNYTVVFKNRGIAASSYLHSICHGGLAAYRSVKVLAIVENMRCHISRIADKKALDMYLNYVLNDHPLADVSLCKKASHAYRYGVPFDVNNFGDFAIRNFAITLRRVMENRDSLSIFRELIENGVHPHAAFMIFDLSFKEKRNNSYYYSGGHDHSFLLGAMKVTEVVSFFKSKYKDPEGTVPFSSERVRPQGLQRTVSPSIGQGREKTLTQLLTPLMEKGVDNSTWGRGQYSFLRPGDKERFENIAKTLNPLFEK